MNEWDLYGGINKSFLESLPIVANENTLTIPLSNANNKLKYNREYKIILLKTIDLHPTLNLENDLVISFMTELKPLYIDPLELQGILLDLMDWFEIKEILIAIKNAGVYVHSLLNMVLDANAPGFVELTEESSNYYIAREFIKYASAIMLLKMAKQKILANDGAAPNASNAASIQLGDFMVSNATASKSQDLLLYLNDQIKHLSEHQAVWMDRLMGRTKRAYTEPIRAITRKVVVAPVKRDLT